MKAIFILIAIFGLNGYLLAQDISVAESISNCEALQKEDNKRVNCWLKEYLGDPHIMFVYQSKEDMDHYAEEMEENIAIPFCENANMKVGLIMVILDNDAIAFNECSIGWSEWESLTEFKNQK